MHEKLIKAPEAAQIIGLSTQTVRAMAERGELPGAVFIGRHLRFDLKKLEEFFDTGGSRGRQGSAEDETLAAGRHVPAAVEVR